MEVIEDQLDSNRPIQGVKFNFDHARLAALRPVAPRVAIWRQEGPAEGQAEPPQHTTPLQ